MKNILSSLVTLSVAISSLFTSCQPSDPKDNALQAFPSMKEMQRPFGNQDDESFVKPDRVHFPETWFHYIGGNVSHEGELGILTP